jgi:hypothetical protein
MNEKFMRASARKLFQGLVRKYLGVLRTIDARMPRPTGGQLEGFRFYWRPSSARPPNADLTLGEAGPPRLASEAREP